MSLSTKTVKYYLFYMLTRLAMLCYWRKIFCTYLSAVCVKLFFLPATFLVLPFFSSVWSRVYSRDFRESDRAIGRSSPTRIVHDELKGVGRQRWKFSGENNRLWSVSLRSTSCTLHSEKQLLLYLKQKYFHTLCCVEYVYYWGSKTHKFIRIGAAKLLPDIKHSV